MTPVTKKTRNASPESAAPDASAELVEAEEAMRLLRTSRSTLYRWVRQGHIRAMKAGRQWRFYREDVERFLHGESPKVFLDRAPGLGSFTETLLAAHEKIAGDPVLPPSDLRAQDPVAYAADLVVHLAVRLGASDIHLSPQRMSDGKIHVPLRFRVDGVLQTQTEIEPPLSHLLISHWKTLAGCGVQEPARPARPQEGAIRVTIPPNRTEDLRLAVLPSSFGEGVVIRLWQLSDFFCKIDQCFEPEECERIGRAVRAPNGILLFTGPTGSGKTTAMLAAVHEIVDPANKIVAIEDAPFTHLPGVDQVAVNEEDGTSLYAALKSIGHADPDVIVCVESPKDLQTLQMCCDLAQTGHLFLFTMTADDACEALLRLLDMGTSPYMIADSVRTVVCQHLVRRLCPKCAAPAKPSPAVLKRLDKILRDGGLDPAKLSHQFRDAKGCPECGGRGFRGREALAEILDMSRSISRALIQGMKRDDLVRLAVSEGMVTQQAALIRMVYRGKTAVREAERVFAQYGW
jgi:type IV pilus assembly protein PilB